MKHVIKPIAYLRHGDDFIIVAQDKQWLVNTRQQIITFLADRLHLEVNRRSDILIKARWGLHFLGVEIFPKGRRLTTRNLDRAEQRLSLSNLSSYSGLIRKHSNDKMTKYFNWKVLEKLEESL